LGGALHQRLLLVVARRARQNLADRDGLRPDALLVEEETQTVSTSRRHSSSVERRPPATGWWMAAASETSAATARQMEECEAEIAAIAVGRDLEQIEMVLCPCRTTNRAQMLVSSGSMR